jgi:hypothetical protein
MSQERFRTLLLLLIVGLLVINPVKTLIRPTPALADTTNLLYFEPGVRMLRAPDGSRQVLGKMAIDLRTGNVWAFPTTVDQPYPADITSQQPPVSKPFLLGKFDLASLAK